MLLEEWRKRYRQRFIETGALDEAAADDMMLSLGDCQELFDEEPTDPEGAADQEMDYWGED